MRLRLLAPVLVDFSVASGAVHRDADGYKKFWDGADEDIDDAWSSGSGAPSTTQPREVTFHHNESQSRFNRYKAIDEPSLERSVEIVTVLIKARDLGLPAEVYERWRGLDDVTCRIYNHAIAIVETEIDVGPAPPEEETADTLEQLQRDAAELGEQVARAVHFKTLDHLTRWLRKRDPERKVIAPSLVGRIGITAGTFGSPLWVTRSLLVAGKTRETDAAVCYWVKDVVAGSTDVDGETRHPGDDLVEGKAKHLVKWLNYVFITGADDSDFEDEFKDVWQALRLAQYFYAALETIDFRLGSILAASLDAGSGRDARSLKGDLEQTSLRARIVQMELDELNKYLTRPVRTEMQQIFEYWGVEEVLIAPIDGKVESCRSRLEDLEKRRRSRSELFTDLILLPITIASIVTTALALTEFGRLMTTDPELAGVDAGRSDVIAWIASQPADVTLVSSAVLSIAVIVLYAYFRRRHSG